jgi:chromosome segregation ATPase
MLKNLKSLFIIQEEEVKEEEKKTSTKAENAAAPLQKTEQTEMAISSIVSRLFTSIEESNQPGFDYFEYKTALKSMEGMPMDEATKFKSAFATASTLGITIQNLVESANFYLKVLENEKAKFASATDQQFKLNIDKKIEEIEIFKKLIADKEEQINKLKGEIGDHYAKLDGLNQHITESKRKIEQTKGSFEMAYSQIKVQMDDDVKKINQYLK